MGPRATGLILVVAACSLAGCARPLVVVTRSAPSSSPTAAVSTIGGIRFPHPGTWELGATGEPPFTMGRVLGFLSTDVLHDPCTITPNSLSCGLPLDRLKPNGVLIEFSSRATPGTRRQLPGETARLVAGTPATVTQGPATSQRPMNGCATLGGQYEVTVTIDAQPAAANGNVLELWACFSGPNTIVARQQFATMLDHARRSG